MNWGDVPVMWGGRARLRWLTPLWLAPMMMLSGCGQTVEGAAIGAVTRVDPATLETGPYPVEPTAFDPDIQHPYQVYAIEARRMLGYLVPPFEFDAELTHLDDVELIDSSSDGLFGDGLNAVYPAEFQDVMQRHHLIAGVLTIRSNDSVRALKLANHALLRFPSDEAARAAAADLDATLHGLNPDLRGLPVPGHEGVEYRTGNGSKGYLVVARGPFVVLTMLNRHEPDEEAILAVASDLLDLQFERLASATVTPIDEILDLPLDPDGIMRRTLPAMKGEWLYGESFVGALSPQAQLHFELDGAAAREAFEDAGVDLVARNYATVYRAGDEQAALRLHTVLAGPARDDEEIDPPPGLDDARCRVLAQEDPVSEYGSVCVLAYGRYVAVVGSTQPSSLGLDPGLYQRAAAQYAILARSEA